MDHRGGSENKIVYSRARINYLLYIRRLYMLPKEIVTRVDSRGENVLRKRSLKKKTEKREEYEEEEEHEEEEKKKKKRYVTKRGL